mmetsp:Transcript_11231/g.27799  ORF Transcript_11231/g.27799 Transcript_11231/m.27799 type:complete len:340 (-) Transcript_11231:2449-3468(-)
MSTLLLSIVVNPFPCLLGLHVSAFCPILAYIRDVLIVVVVPSPWHDTNIAIFALSNSLLAQHKHVRIHVFVVAVEPGLVGGIGLVQLRLQELDCLLEAYSPITLNVCKDGRCLTLGVTVDNLLRHEIDRSGSDIDDALVISVVHLGNSDVSLQKILKERKDLILKLDRNSEDTVEECAEERLLARLGGIRLREVKRLEGFCCLTKERVDIPDRCTEIVKALLRKHCLIKDHLKKLLESMETVLTVDGEFDEILRVSGSPPVSLRQCSQTLQPVGNSRCEPRLSTKRRKEELKLGCGTLVGAVRPAHLLNGLVCGPWQLQSDVHPPALIRHPPVRLKGDA